MSGIVELGKESTQASSLKYGRTLVGLTAVPVNLYVENLRYNIVIRANGSGDPLPNTAFIYVGDKNVTVNTGFPIPPGSSVELFINNVNEIYVISSAINQEIAWIGL
jgi:hypothetical protein